MVEFDHLARDSCHNIVQFLSLGRQTGGRGLSGNYPLTCTQYFGCVHTPAHPCAGRGSALGLGEDDGVNPD